MRGLSATFEALYKSSYRQVVGLLIALGSERSAAEEIAQDAFIKLWRDWDRLQQYDEPGAWVRHVAVRALASQLRRDSNRARIVREAETGQRCESSDADGGLDLDRAIQALPLAQRQVLVLYYTLQMPVREIALLLDVSVGTVQSRLSRARQALAVTLTEEYEQ